MKTTIIAIGKKHDTKIIQALEHYNKMLSSSFAPEWLLLDAKHTGVNSIESVKISEGKLLLTHTQPDDIVIVLDENGKQLSSPEFATTLQNYQNQAAKRVVFIIGGAFGLDESVKNRANFIWSLSKLVLPHQLVRLVLIEQLYRASTILAGKQYHY